jgi:hypothetical protein
MAMEQGSFRKTAGGVEALVNIGAIAAQTLDTCASQIAALFNAHLHVMVSAGGLKESEGRWIAPLRFDRRALMHIWRYAVIAYLRAALKKGLLVSEASPEELRVVLATQYERWWNVYVDHVRSSKIRVLHP